MKQRGRPKAALTISNSEREELVSLTKRSRVNRNVAFRAKIVATGKVIARCKQKHRSIDFVAFLREIDDQVDQGFEIHVVLDNLSAHKSPVVYRRLLHELGPAAIFPAGCSRKSRARRSSRLGSPRMAALRRATTVALPARKPMAVARRVALFEREIRVHLGTAAIEILFRVAQTLSEGQLQGKRYFGSTMITIDLERAREHVRDECDAASARHVAELLARDIRVGARARAAAIAAAAERAGAPLARLEADLRARAAGACVHLDLDVEGTTS